MLNDDEMNLNERRKYLKRMKPRYESANRKERGVLLSEMEQVTGMHRKSLTRLKGGNESGTEETKHSAFGKLWNGGWRG